MSEFVSRSLENIKQDLDTFTIFAKDIALSDLTDLHKKIDTFIEEIQDVEPTYVEKFSECIFQYIDCISRFVESHINQHESRSLCQIITKIPRLLGIQKKYLEEISIFILEKVTDPSLPLWFTQDLLTNFNLSLVYIDKKFLYKTVPHNILLNLCQLVDMLGVCGDYSYQVKILKTIFAIYSPQKIPELAVSFFPESENLQKSLCSINEKTLSYDVRQFLNIINKNNCNVFSLNPESTLLNNVYLYRYEQNQRNGLWVDFNVGVNTISILCNEKCIENQSPSEDFGENEDVTIIINVPDIAAVEMSRWLQPDYPRSIGSIVCFTLKDSSCIARFLTYEQPIKINKLVLYVSHSAALKELENVVLPFLFENRLKILSSTPHQDHQSQDNRVSTGEKAAVRVNLTSHQREYLHTNLSNNKTKFSRADPTLDLNKEILNSQWVETSDSLINHEASETLDSSSIILIDDNQSFCSTHISGCVLYTVDLTCDIDDNVQSGGKKSVISVDDETEVFYSAQTNGKSVHTQNKNLINRLHSIGIPSCVVDSINLTQDINDNEVIYLSGERSIEAKDACSSASKNSRNNGETEVFYSAQTNYISVDVQKKGFVNGSYSIGIPSRVVDSINLTQDINDNEVVYLSEERNIEAKDAFYSAKQGNCENYVLFSNVNPETMDVTTTIDDSINKILSITNKTTQSNATKLNTKQIIDSLEKNILSSPNVQNIVHAFSPKINTPIKQLLTNVPAQTSIANDNHDQSEIISRLTNIVIENAVHKPINSQQENHAETRSDTKLKRNLNTSHFKPKSKKTCRFMVGDVVNVPEQENDEKLQKRTEMRFNEGEGEIERSNTKLKSTPFKPRSKESCKILASNAVNIPEQENDKIPKSTTSNESENDIIWINSANTNNSQVNNLPLLDTEKENVVIRSPNSIIQDDALITDTLIQQQISNTKDTQKSEKMSTETSKTVPTFAVVTITSEQAQSPGHNVLENSSQELQSRNSPAGNSKVTDLKAKKTPFSIEKSHVESSSVESYAGFRTGTLSTERFNSCRQEEASPIENSCRQVKLAQHEVVGQMAELKQNILLNKLGIAYVQLKKLDIKNQAVESYIKREMTKNYAKNLPIVKIEQLNIEKIMTANKPTIYKNVKPESLIPLQPIEKKLDTKIIKVDADNVEADVFKGHNQDQPVSSVCSSPKNPDNTDEDPETSTQFLPGTDQNENFTGKTKEDVARKQSLRNDKSKNLSRLKNWNKKKRKLYNPDEQLTLSQLGLREEDLNADASLSAVVKTTLPDSAKLPPLIFTGPTDTFRWKQKNKIVNKSVDDLSSNESVLTKNGKNQSAAGKGRLNKKTSNFGSNKPQQGIKRKSLSTVPAWKTSKRCMYLSAFLDNIIQSSQKNKQKKTGKYLSTGNSRFYHDVTLRESKNKHKHFVREECVLKNKTDATRITKLGISEPDPNPKEIPYNHELNHPLQVVSKIQETTSETVRSKINIISNVLIKPGLENDNPKSTTARPPAEQELSSYKENKNSNKLNNALEVVDNIKLALTELKKDSNSPEKVKRDVDEFLLLNKGLFEMLLHFWRGPISSELIEIHELCEEVADSLTKYFHEKPKCSQ